MKAIRKMRPERYATELVDIPEPKVQPGQVKIKVEYCGICGSDVAFYRWSMDPGMKLRVPFTFGHEYCGVITELGEGVSEDLHVGDRVVSETAAYICGKCEQCMTGNYLLCKNKRSIGYQADGAMAEYITIRHQIVHHIPDNVSFEEAALCEPAGVTAHTVYDLAKPVAGETAIVFGPGAIGLLTLAHLKACNCKTILVGMKKDAERLEVGKELGADYILLSDECDVVEEISKITNGKGADVAFECTGAGPVLRIIPLVLKKQGKACIIALFPNKDVPIDTWNVIVNNEITLMGSFGSRNWGWTKVLELLEQKKLNIRPIATHIFGIDDWKQAFDLAEAQKGLKILIKP